MGFFFYDLSGAIVANSVTTVQSFSPRLSILTRSVQAERNTLKPIAMTKNTSARCRRAKDTIVRQYFCFSEQQSELDSMKIETEKRLRTMSTAHEKRLDELKWKLSHPAEIKSIVVLSRRNQRAGVAEKEVGLQQG